MVFGLKSGKFLILFPLMFTVEGCFYLFFERMAAWNIHSAFILKIVKSVGWTFRGPVFWKSVWTTIVTPKLFIKKVWKERRYIAVVYQKPFTVAGVVDGWTRIVVVGRGLGERVSPDRYPRRWRSHTRRSWHYTIDRSSSTVSRPISKWLYVHWMRLL